MFAWCLASGSYPPLTGEGARLVGGRWNSPGRPLVYASESLALCLAECLVHVTGRLPTNYVAFKVSFPDNETEVLSLKTLRAGWERDLTKTRAVGDKWLAEARSLALIVPSAVLPESRNILLNPQHPAAARMRVISRKPFTFDPRLAPRAEGQFQTRRPAGALSQGYIEHRPETRMARRAKLTADKLGLLAWQTTYKNRHTKTK